MIVFTECSSEAPIGEGDRHHVAAVQGGKGECHGEGCGECSSSLFIVKKDFHKSFFDVSRNRCF